MASRLNIPAKQIKLFKDQTLKQELKGRDTDLLSKLGLKNGDMLHVGNQDVELASVVETKAKAEAKAQRELKEKEEEEKKQEEEKV